MGMFFHAKCDYCYDPIPCHCEEQQKRDWAGHVAALRETQRRIEEQTRIIEEQTRLIAEQVKLLRARNKPSK